MDEDPKRGQDHLHAGKTLLGNAACYIRNGLLRAFPRQEMLESLNSFIGQPFAPNPYVEEVRKRIDALGIAGIVHCSLRHIQDKI